jgi:hypothetical protein
VRAKTLIIAATALLLADATPAGDSLPLQSVNRANEIIDAAIEAHGGGKAVVSFSTRASSSTAKTAGS